jgi:GNAT superfamily N-acetyltransferase
MPVTEVVRTYLEMTSPAELRPAWSDDPAVRVERVRDCPPSFYRYLYRTVGGTWHWRDRAEWSDEQIAARLGAPGVTLDVMYVGGAPAGWVEMERHGEGATEIVYFGLLPELAGRGLGKHLLSYATRAAWDEGAHRVWLHTCTLDSPRALPNYLARGFREFRRERYETELPAGE